MARDFRMTEQDRRSLAACALFLQKQEKARARLQKQEREAHYERLDGAEIFPHDALPPMTAYERLKATGDTEDLRMEGAELAAAWPYIRRVESALAKLPPFQGIAECRVDLPQPVAAMIEVGALFRNSGFLDASASRDWREGPYHLVIRSRTGRLIKDYTRHPDYMQVLFRPGTLFRILAVESPAAKSAAAPTRIFLEEIA